jgi:hypothetical protein
MRNLIFTALLLLLLVPSASARTEKNCNEEETPAARESCMQKERKEDIADSVKRYKDQIEERKDRLEYSFEQEENLLERDWRSLDFYLRDNEEFYRRRMEDIRFADSDNDRVAAEKALYENAKDIRSLEKKRFSTEKSLMKTKQKLQEQQLDISLIEYEVRLRQGWR